MINVNNGIVDKVWFGLERYGLLFVTRDLIRPGLGIAIQQRFQSSWIFAVPTQFQLDPARIQQFADFFKEIIQFLKKYPRNI